MHCPSGCAPLTGTPALHSLLLLVLLSIFASPALSSIVPLPARLSGLTAQVERELASLSDCDCLVVSDAASRTASSKSPPAIYPSCFLRSPALPRRCIPRIIHQTWKEQRPPAELNSYYFSWTQVNPGWIRLFWTDKDMREWLANNYAWFLPTFDDYEHPVQRADAFRYFVLHAYGGVYADLDYEALQPLDSYTPNITHPLAFVGPGDWPTSISNSLMMSRHCPALWEPLLRRLVRSAVSARKGFWGRFPSSRVMSSTGPTFLRYWLQSERPEYICRLVRAQFSPCDYCTSTCKTDGAYTAHHYARSWNRWDTATVNLLVCYRYQLLLVAVLALLCRCSVVFRRAIRAIIAAARSLLTWEIACVLCIIPLPLLLVYYMPPINMS